jgi:uncharacterized protein
MTPRAIAGLLFGAFLLLITGGPTVVAENDDRLRFPQIERQFIQPEKKPVVRIPRAAVERVAPAPRRSVPTNTIVVQDAPIKPKVDPSIFVTVIGDSMGDLLAHGLDQAYADMPEVAVVKKSKADTGFVRNDFYDWPKAVQDLLAGSERISFGVMMIGVNDRQVMREGDTTLEPGSPRWKELYIARVDSVVRAFADKKIPLVWVGLPPMRNERFAAEMFALNEIYRDRVQKGGGVFVDIWEAFADSENRYSAIGPDMQGQMAKLRTNDGVHFTKAGARKAAHFADIEIKRLMGTKGPATVIALPNSSLELDIALRPGGVERLIDGSMPTLPEPPGAFTIPVKPAAGPILQLTRPDLSPGGVLASGRPRVSGDAGALIERVFGQGRAPDPRPGRADDFRWPRAGS